ncbi:TonB-dependent receptor [Zunongwangia sp. HGR-M22]|uniref:TonB-dependent receptor n=1 Tax=Zunongwangia sp. HGR-M22 TaxID=3015168 RepID=UPI0022DE2279|nr:TonB-dependent receptor [Zunongwangia sp. HGR-M22]WBL25536.1 carboxypeptidase-like regulatory domain-containing protein [Zunongwangia sp. HGR-M22]
MKKITNLLFVAFMMLTAFAQAQGVLTGKVVDGETDTPLPGVNVIVKGTSIGVTTDFDGLFEIKVEENQGILNLSYVGFASKSLNFTLNNSEEKDLGTIQLEMDEGALDEVLVTAYSLAIDRKTPVAVSTVKSEEIALKLGTQEFPEILKTTPGIYATKQGGGYGDGRVNIRGFNSENVAVMINGVPVNDMENGAVYWSNWAGLGDVTSTMQVQRGLGAAKVAVPSVGGTINIVTKSIDAIEGGKIMSSIGNNGYLKYGMTYSTGLSEKGFAATVSASKISGDGYVNGLEFSGYNYFVNLSQQINENHLLSFNAFGAQQEHGQRYTRFTIEDYKRSEAGPRRFNADWGYKNGEVYNSAYNFYHKPQISLNHYWTVNDKTNISTALYASFGSGGGRRTDGDKIGADDYRLGGFDQPIDFDQIVDENIERGSMGAGSSDMIYASKNSHEWYGILSTFKNRTTDKLTISGGLDARYYIGSHWYEITDLLGGSYWMNDRSNDLNEGQALQVGDTFGKDYDGQVIRGGVFGQLEYDVLDNLNVFASANVSRTVYSLENNLKDIEKKNSDHVYFTEYGVKGGANYNFTDNQNVFANVGYFTRAPFLTNVFLNATGSTEANTDAVNEKIFSAELGYGFRLPNLKVALNLYRTNYMDKAVAGSYSNPDDQNTRLFYNLQGVDAVHQGIELEASYNITDKFKVNGMLSLGDWEWQNNVEGVKQDEDGNVTGNIFVYSKDLKVGNAAQTTFALGASYDFAPKSTLFVDYNYAGNMYADYYVEDRDDPDAEGIQTWKAPEYGLFDLGIKHAFDFGPFNASLIGRINNALNTEYVSDANDQGNGAQNALVYFGAGRTYSVSFNLKF